MGTSDNTTRGIHVHVESSFDPARSKLQEQAWFFLYTVTITNHGSETVQLRTRHWLITDGNGHVQDVRGPGVVGEQPILEPGEGFQYTSGCPLPTAYGFMRGSFQMLTKSGEQFDAVIGTFELSEPYTVN